MLKDKFIYSTISHHLCLFFLACLLKFLSKNQEMNQEILYFAVKKKYYILEFFFYNYVCFVFNNNFREIKIY